MLVIGVAPLFAPTIGVGGARRWRAVFVAPALFGALVWSACGASRETLPSAIAPGHGITGGLLDLLRDLRFRGLRLVRASGVT